MAKLSPVTLRGLRQTWAKVEEMTLGDMVDFNGALDAHADAWEADRKALEEAKHPCTECGKTPTVRPYDYMEWWLCGPCAAQRME